MRTFHAIYRLRNGARGVLTVIGRSSCDAVLCAIDTFGEQLLRCSARPA